MEGTGNETGDTRKFALPLCLLSLIFFSVYIILICTFLFGGSLQSWLDLVTPSSKGSFLASLSPTVIGGIFSILPFIGSLLFIREMKLRPYAWKTGLPLCVIFGVIIASTIISISLPLAVIQKFFGVIAIIGFAIVPLGLANLLKNLKEIETDESDIKDIQSFSTNVGYFGLLVALGLVYLILTYVQPVPNPKYDEMWNFDLVGIAVFFFGGIYGAVLLPAIGIPLFQLGLKFRKISLDPKKAQDM
jgi:hypothetical protein